MTTTSLDISRKLDAAGFWKGNDNGGVWFTRPSGADSYRRATLDDLIPALGLDKPWGSWDELEKRFSFLIGVKDYGLTPDVLAQVWLDTNGGDHD